MGDATRGRRTIDVDACRPGRTPADIGVGRPAMQMLRRSIATSRAAIAGLGEIDGVEVRGGKNGKLEKMWQTLRIGLAVLGQAVKGLEEPVKTARRAQCDANVEFRLTGVPPRVTRS